jgi:hypothetical protein
MPRRRLSNASANFGSTAMTEEFRNEVRTAIRRHADELDADDLRSLAADLEEEADRWEGMVI